VFPFFLKIGQKEPEISYFQFSQISGQ
jgi:hypothetical protein